MSGKVILVTGASSGIGEAVARRLASTGASLVLGARGQEKLETVTDAINASGGAAVATTLDVTSRTSMEAFVKLACDRFGRVDVLVSNAGAMLLAPLVEARVDDWDRMIDVNLRGLLNGVAATLPLMMAQQSGHMVIIGSLSGGRVTPSGGIYAATKFATRAVVDSIRLECGSVVRTTLITPGATHTDMVERLSSGMPPEEGAAWRKKLLTPDVVARAVAYAIEQPDEVDVSEVTLRPKGMQA